jgi:predicted MFS family arabinose efflux permease
LLECIKEYFIKMKKTAKTQTDDIATKTALRFVILIGILSFFSDFTHEGARSILGPYLAMLQANAFTIGVVTGFGELLGYSWRFVSGRLADQTQKFWPIIIVGYVVQMTSVPLLALAGNWQMAAVLIILERAGRATRNPPRDVMLSHTGKQLGGYGWVFGMHQAMDQFGAMVGPLVVAWALAVRGDYHFALAALAVPAAINIILVLVAYRTYPHPEKMEVNVPNVQSRGLPRVFWLYLAGAVLVAAGFADFPLIAYHFAKTSVVAPDVIPVFYAVAMGVSGAGSLAFGRLFDRFGFSVLIFLTITAAFFAPLVFLGGFWAALIGMALWGLGMGVHESIIPAAVAPMVAPERRASAYGLFTAGYGIFWFLGSAMIGFLYGISLPALIAFSMILQLAAVPFFFIVAKQMQSVQ